ncbi:hypothetical protein BH09BAC5_BH09BAC5_01900 [soil metagenome]
MNTQYFFNPAYPKPIVAINTCDNSDQPAAMIPTEKTNTSFLSLESELNARLELIDKSSLVTITDLEGNILYVNNLFCEVSGYARHELIGKLHEKICDPEMTTETHDGIVKRLLEGKSWSGTIKNTRRNGDFFWCNTSVAPVLDESGIPCKFIWMRNDITDLKRTEKELYAAKDRVDQRIFDNVNHAFNIQNAILPDEKSLREIFPTAFLISSPVQNVSGDFFWFDQQKDETIFVLGDGTGHGVSASYISLIAVTALEFIVKQQKETDPGKILTELNDFIYRALNKHKNSGLSESLDMGICTYNSKTKMMRYATCKSKIHLVRTQEIYPLDRDEISIGSKSKEEFSINSKSVLLHKGDRIFMMSDGFCDQMGGIRNKKMGSKQTRELLKNTAYQSIEKQKEMISDYFLTWKGGNEQTDDLSLLGICIN